MKKILKKAWPHALAILVFIVISSWYFTPTFSGYELSQSDIESWRGMSKEILDYRMVNEEEPLWTNSMFGGMPAYQIATIKTNNWLSHADSILKLGLPRPVGSLFMLMLGFYILCLCLNIRSGIALIGSLAFGLSSFHFLFLGAGHTSKINALSYMAPTLGALLLCYRRNLLGGVALFALFFGLHVAANHLQITYYFLMLLSLIAIAELTRSIIEKNFLRFVKSSVALLAGVVIGLLPNASNLLPTNEYSHYSNRGATDITIQPEGADEEERKDGLSNSYILEYSYGDGEIWSLFIPDVKGGQSGRIGSDPKLLKGIPADYKEAVSGNNRYWGGQRYTGGAIYLGAAVIFLFILGLFFVRDLLKWPLLVAVLLALALCQQENALNDFFIKNVPMYNKFRDTKMTLVLAVLVVPLLATLFLDWFGKTEVVGKQRKWMLIVPSALFLMLILFNSTPKSFFSFQAREEAAQFEEYAATYPPGSREAEFVDGVLENLETIRVEIFKADVQRTILIVFAAIAILLLSLFRVVKFDYLLPVLGIIIMADLVLVDQRYLNNKKVKGGYKSYVKHDEKVMPYAPSVADNFILDIEKNAFPEYDEVYETLLNKMKTSGEFASVKNKAMVDSLAQFGALNLTTDYRIITTGNIFNDASNSYFHKTVGGYHAAKLRRYQDVIEFHLAPELAEMTDSLKANNPNAFDNLPVINMLNAKYLVYNPGAMPLVNERACGNAWFVSEVNQVADANEEIIAIGDIDPSKTAIVRAEFSALVSAPAGVDSAATINLTEYKTNYLKYTSKSRIESPAVFSEIYYPAGWKCLIDGNEVPYFCANYILRGVTVPAGEHTIEWKFEPTSYRTGSTVSLAGSCGLFLLLLTSLFIEFRRRTSLVKA